MKRNNTVLLSALVIFITISGCATTQELSTTVKSKVSSLTSTVDPALINQIPADKREGFAKAEFDLKVAEEKETLAQLKTEQASLQKACSEYEEDKAASFRKEAQIDYDLVKIEAVIKAGLGKKDENLKIKADLQSKKLKAQADRINIQASVDIAKSKIDDLAKQIVKAEENIKSMQFTP